MVNRFRQLATRLSSTVDFVREDLEMVKAHDPAARGSTEILLAYPGLHALWLHRVAHQLWKRGHVLSARLLSHMTRWTTGVEIHPGARIGRSVFIDHGMGVVIGETAVIGDHCILYKGVVLGGTHTKPCKRHPQLGNHVVVGSNACILGSIEIGDGARIGSGSVVIRSVPPGATVVGVPGRIVPEKGDRRSRFDAALNHADLPDPISSMLRSLKDENELLRQRLQRIEAALGTIAEEPEEPDTQLLDGELATTDLPPQHGG